MFHLIDCRLVVLVVCLAVFTTQEHRAGGIRLASSQHPVLGPQQHGSSLYRRQRRRKQTHVCNVCVCTWFNPQAHAHLITQTCRCRNSNLYGIVTIGGHGKDTREERMKAHGANDFGSGTHLLFVCLCVCVFVCLCVVCVFLCVCVCVATFLNRDQ